MTYLTRTAQRWLAGVVLALHSICASSAEPSYRSHPPMRPLAVPSQRPLAAGPSYFVDPVKGDDQSTGALDGPWKSVKHALKQLKPGDTLYLRGGTHYEDIAIAVSGTDKKPITIRSYPGELAILDAGIREFCEEPARAWEPWASGAKGEFRSTKAYRSGGGFGNFADSMVPFHRYMTFADLRSTNELCHVGLGNRADDSTGIYAGPGTRRDPETGRIHIRLAHTTKKSVALIGFQG